MAIKIETATIRLLDRLCQIEEQCFDQEAFTKRQISYLLTDFNTIGLVAKADSDIAGFIIAQVEIENETVYGHIITLNIPPQYRRKGIATRLLNEIETIVRQKGITELHLEVKEDNNAAIKLYQRLNYKKIAKLEKYYGNKHGLYLKKTF